MLPIRIILCPTDFSECSDDAFRAACRLARDYAARLLVLHVVPPPAAVYDVEAERLAPEGPFQATLKELRSLEPPFALDAVEYRLAEGDPAAEIVRAATDTACDVIVMGTHGRTSVSRWFLGSVAELVVREAPCPVVTLKTRARKEVLAAAPPASVEEHAAGDLVGSETR